jgi:hypothetical protein
MMAGFESPDHLLVITGEFWPTVANRLTQLDTEALVVITGVADDWGRLSRRLEGAFGTKPTAEAAGVAGSFLQVLLPTLTAACAGKPAAQLALHDASRLSGLRIHQDIDPEFRILTWTPWRLIGRGQDTIFSRTVGRLADQWAAEEPSVLMTRLAGWGREAAKRQRSLDPMIRVALQALGERDIDLGRLISAGLAAGLSWELDPLFRASVDHSHGVPDWLAGALGGPARPNALSAALESQCNRPATKKALKGVQATDLPVVEQVIIRRGHAGHDWVSLALLRHPVDEVRGTASLWFGLDGTDHAPALSEDWYSDWAEAFLVAPLLTSRGGDNYRLGEQLKRLVARDPDLVERWLARQMSANPDLMSYRLPPQAQASLLHLPRANRDRLMRAASGESYDGALLACLLGEDVAWLEQLLDEGAVDIPDVLQTIHFSSEDVSHRARRVMAVAPSLVPRGVEPARLASMAQYGSWTGEESDNFEAIRAAFAAAEAADPHSEAVREAGVSMFERKRDEARNEERKRRVSGDL